MEVDQEGAAKKRGGKSSRGRGGKAGKGGATVDAPAGDDIASQAVRWVQCDACSKWRRLPAGIDLSDFEGDQKWTCADNSSDPDRSSCSVPEESSTLPRPSSSSLDDSMGMGTGMGISAGEDRDREGAEEGGGKSKGGRGRGRGRGGRAGRGRAGVARSTSEDISGGMEGGGGGQAEGPAGTGEAEWVACDACEKWRKLPSTVRAADLPDSWTCAHGSWDPHLVNAGCSLPQEGWAGAAGGEATMEGQAAGAALEEAPAKRSRTEGGPSRGRAKSNAGLAMASSPLPTPHHSQGAGRGCTLSAPASSALRSLPQDGLVLSSSTYAAPYESGARKGMTPPAYVKGHRESHEALLVHMAEAWVDPAGGGGILSEAVSAAWQAALSAGSSFSYGSLSLGGAGGGVGGGPGGGGGGGAPHISYTRELITSAGWANGNRRKPRSEKVDKAAAAVAVESASRWAGSVSYRQPMPELGALPTAGSGAGAGTGAGTGTGTAVEAPSTRGTGVHAAAQHPSQPHVALYKLGAAIRDLLPLWPNAAAGVASPSPSPSPATCVRPLAEARAALAVLLAAAYTTTPSSALPIPVSSSIPPEQCPCAPFARHASGRGPAGVCALGMGHGTPMIQGVHIQHLQVLAADLGDRERMSGLSDTLSLALHFQSLMSLAPGAGGGGGVGQRQGGGKAGEEGSTSAMQVDGGNVGKTDTPESEAAALVRAGQGGELEPGSLHVPPYTSHAQVGVEERHAHTCAVLCVAALYRVHQEVPQALQAACSRYIRPGPCPPLPLSLLASLLGVGVRVMEVRARQLAQAGLLQVADRACTLSSTAVTALGSLPSLYWSARACLHVAVPVQGAGEAIHGHGPGPGLGLAVPAPWSKPWRAGRV